LREPAIVPLSGYTGALQFAIVVAIAFCCFQFFLIATATQFHGRCFSEFWMTTGHGGLSPHRAFSAPLVCFLVWLIVWAWRTAVRRFMPIPMLMAIALIGIATLGSWRHVLQQLGQVVSTERVRISVEQTGSTRPGLHRIHPSVDACTGEH